MVCNDVSSLIRQHKQQAVSENCLPVLWCLLFVGSGGLTCLISSRTLGIVSTALWISSILQPSSG